MSVSSNITIPKIRFCKECPHWQKHPFIKGRGRWGDCYYIVGYLNPGLFKLFDRFGHPFSLPFDPHDIKYFYENINAKVNKSVPKGVRIKIEKEEDLVFEPEGECYQTIQVVDIMYFQTNQSFSCEKFLESSNLRKRKGKSEKKNSPKRRAGIRG